MFHILMALKNSTVRILDDWRFLTCIKNDWFYEKALAYDSEAN